MKITSKLSLSIIIYLTSLFSGLFGIYIGIYLLGGEHHQLANVVLTLRISLFLLIVLFWTKSVLVYLTYFNSDSRKSLIVFVLRAIVLSALIYELAAHLAFIGTNTTVVPFIPLIPLD